MAAFGITVLDGQPQEITVSGQTLQICGISDPLTHGTGLFKPRLDLLNQRSAPYDGFSLLLAHRPSYIEHYLPGRYDLVLSGHAHGGQWRAFGLAAYAPGQGIFPKYTSGVIDGRCVISRGLGNHTIYPRFFNPRELVIVHYGETAPSKKQKKRVAKT